MCSTYYSRENVVFGVSLQRKHTRICVSTLFLCSRICVFLLLLHVLSVFSQRPLCSKISEYFSLKKKPACTNLQLSKCKINIAKSMIECEFDCEFHDSAIFFNFHRLFRFKFIYKMKNNLNYGNKTRILNRDFLFPSFYEIFETVF